MALNPEDKAEADGVRRPEVSDIQAPPTSGENEVAESLAPPPNQVKVDALRRLKALERRGKTWELIWTSYAHCSRFFLNKCRTKNRLGDPIKHVAHRV